MQGKKPNGYNFMRVIEWNEIWEFRVLHKCGKKFGFYPEYDNPLGGKYVPPGDSY